MTNKTQSEQPTNNQPSEQSLLTEYKALGDYNNSIASQYWTMTGIFIGFSSALLGGLAYSVLSNDISLQDMLTKGSLLLGVITYVVSIAVLLILYFLRYWVNRVVFLQQINFMRMREIEVITGMRGSLRVQGIDCLKNLEEELRKLETAENKEKINKVENELRGFCNRLKFKSNYERSSRWHYQGIFFVLFTLWALVLLGGLYSLCIYSCAAILIAIILLVIVCFIVFLYRRHNPKKG